MDPRVAPLRKDLRDLIASGRLDDVARNDKRRFDFDHVIG